MPELILTSNTINEQRILINDAFSGLSSNFLPLTGGTVSGATNLIGAGVNLIQFTNSGMTNGVFNSVGPHSFASGIGSVASGDYSSAFGSSVVASGTGSTANGYSNIASGDYSSAFGSGTIASGISSFASGADTIASGDGSHAEGSASIASGSSSHAEGGSNIASGANSHAEGSSNIASGQNSHAGGSNVIASGQNSRASGMSNGSFPVKASGIASFAHFRSTISLTGASGMSSFILGGLNHDVIPDYSGIIGGTSNRILSGINSVIIGGTGNTINGYEGIVILGKKDTTGTTNFTTYVDKIDVENYVDMNPVTVLPTSKIGRMFLSGTTLYIYTGLTFSDLARVKFG